MKKFVVLIDFTSTSEIALHQAIASAKGQGTSLVLLHVLGHFQEAKRNSALSALEALAAQAQAAGLSAKAEVLVGDLYSDVADYVRDHAIDMVFVGTHGIQGLKQTLFGSNIYKLVKGLTVPALVVNDKCKVVEDGFKKILLPVAPHEEFLVKVTQAQVLLAKEGSIVLFAIMKPGINLDEPTSRNLQKAKAYLDAHGVNYSYETVDATHFGLGYARETLEIVQNMDIDMIGILTRVSVENQAFGRMDKEGMLLNDLGLPILCSNQA